MHETLLRIWIPVFALGDTAWTAFFVSLPVLVVDRFDADPRIAGWLLASFGVGAVVGNAIATASCSSASRAASSRPAWWERPCRSG